MRDSGRLEASDVDGCEVPVRGRCGRGMVILSEVDGNS